MSAPQMSPESREALRKAVVDYVERSRRAFDKVFHTGPRLAREVRAPRLRDWAVNTIACLLVGAITLLITLTISMLLSARKPALPAPARIHPVMPNVPE